MLTIHTPVSRILMNVCVFFLLDIWKNAFFGNNSTKLLMRNVFFLQDSLLYLLFSHSFLSRWKWTSMRHYVSPFSCRNFRWKIRGKNLSTNGKTRAQKKKWWKGEKLRKMVLASGKRRPINNGLAYTSGKMQCRALIPLWISIYLWCSCIIIPPVLIWRGYCLHHFICTAEPCVSQ